MLLTIQKTLEHVSEWTGRFIAWLVLAMVLLTFAIVVFRYAFNTGWIAMQESVLYMHAMVFMLGSAFALKHNQHVRVDIFYHRFSARGKAWVDLIGVFLFLLPVCGYLLWSSWEYVFRAWELSEGSADAGGLSWVYLLKTLLLLMPFLLIIQALADIFKSISVIFSRSIGKEV